MRTPVELTIDVTEAAGLGIEAHTAITVFLPDEGEFTDQPVICFAFPGGGYCRRYYSFDMPGASGGGEAGFHCARGWFFVACEPLGFADSTIRAGKAITLDNVAPTNHEPVSDRKRAVGGKRQAISAKP